MGMQGTLKGDSSPALVRMFIRASTEEELVQMQLKTNVLLLGKADFTDIQWVESKNLWYAWFLVDVDKNRDAIEALRNGNTR